MPEAQGPVVVIAHGFAGSRPSMNVGLATEAWRRRGFITVSFDFEGHGTHPGADVGRCDHQSDGTHAAADGRKRRRVTDFAESALPGRCAEGSHWWVHSMASDVVVRQGIADDRVDAIIGISIFSQAVTEAAPQNLLMLNGAWEAALRADAERAFFFLMVGTWVPPEAKRSARPCARAFARLSRCLCFLPHVEHVGAVLYAPSGIAAGIDWLVPHAKEGGLSAVHPALRPGGRSGRVGSC